jgi:hypothetical protein
MKKILSIVTLLTILALSLFGCSSAPKHFKGEWKFSQITKVELSTEVSADTLELLKEYYGVDTEEGVENSALAQFIEDGTFNSYYIRFDKKYTYTNDPLMEREATWVFYQTGENEGFISYDAELDASAGNPAPEVFPEISYDAETDTLTIVERYSSYMVTLALIR